MRHMRTAPNHSMGDHAVAGDTAETASASRQQVMEDSGPNDEDQEAAVSSQSAMRLIFDDPSAEIELVRTVRGPSAPRTIEIRFEPGSPDDQLRGEPASLCDTPLPGQSLTCAVPVPPSPSAPETVVTVRVGRVGTPIKIQVPIRIKRTT